jgi:hypothetical protein
LKAIYEKIKAKPLIIPSQELDWHAFNARPEEGSYSSTCNTSLKNVVMISAMFPKRSNDYTVFENPIWENVNLKVNGVQYPDEVVTTVGGRFLEDQLVAAELDGVLECTKEYKDSYCQEKNAPDGARYENTLSDTTAFMFNVQTERSGAGYCFDGLDTKGQNVDIQLEGTPIFKGVNNTYYNCGPIGNVTSVHPPQPECWICKDTFFVAGDFGMVYKKDDYPYGSQAVGSI